MHKNLGHTKVNEKFGKKKAWYGLSNEIHIWTLAAQVELNSAECLLRKKEKSICTTLNPVKRRQVWIYFGSGQTFTKNTVTLFLLKWEMRNTSTRITGAPHWTLAIHAWLCKSPKHSGRNLYDYLFKLHYEAHTNTPHASLSFNVAIRNQNLQMIKQMLHGTVQIHVAWDQEAAINDNSGGTWRTVVWKYVNHFW